MRERALELSFSEEVVLAQVKQDREECFRWDNQRQGVVQLFVMPAVPLSADLNPSWSILNQFPIHLLGKQ